MSAVIPENPAVIENEGCTVPISIGFDNYCLRNLTYIVCSACLTCYREADGVSVIMRLTDSLGVVGNTVALSTVVLVCNCAQAASYIATS